MIKPEYLAQLRYRFGPCEVLLMVQLEQKGKQWWPSFIAAADELGMHRNTMRKALRILIKNELVGCHLHRAGQGGFWLWWVKRSTDDKPPCPPCWKLRDMQNNRTAKIPINGLHEWCAKRNYKYNTVYCFLTGYSPLLDRRYRLISTPIDAITEADDLALIAA